MLRFLEEQNMKSPFVTSESHRTHFNPAGVPVRARSTRTRTFDTYRATRAGLAIFLSSLAVAMITFLVVMSILMAFS